MQFPSRGSGRRDDSLSADSKSRLKRRLGGFEGEQASKVITIVSEELSIGVTVLQTGYDVATLNSG
jgi:hypothetical protein